MNAHYNGNDIRLAIRPLLPLDNKATDNFKENDGWIWNNGWTLAVFRDHSFKQRMMLNTLVLTIIYSCAYFISLVLALTFGARFLDRMAGRYAAPKLDWFRPSE